MIENNSQEQKLSQAEGVLVAALALDEHRAIARMSGHQLFAVADDPRKAERDKDVEGDSDLEHLRAMRKEVQRFFVGAKARNVEPYARYVVNVVEGKIEGMTPAIILHSEQPLPIEKVGRDFAYIQIPWGTTLVAMDGETQLAARFLAKQMSPQTATENIPIMICHGRPLKWARQAFHDLNLLAVRPNATLGLSMDERDPITHVARLIESEVPFFRGRVNQVSRQLKKSDIEVVTITALRGACCTLAGGIGAIKYGSRPMPLEPDRRETVSQVAVDWFGSVADIIGPAIENREKCLASAPPILAAIGALGHPLVETDDNERAAAKARLLDQLRLVRWEKGERWHGVAGKVTPKGTFSLGGTKEHAYQVYSALSDRNDAAYSQIRMTSAAAA